MMDNHMKDLQSLGSELHEVSNQFQAAAEFNQLKDQVEKLEAVCHAFWLMLSKKGYTNEEFDEALAQVYEIRKAPGVKLTGLRCPSCGKGAQLSKSFKIKCIYCGMEAIINPYEIYDLFDAAEAEEANRRAEEESRKAYGVDYAQESFEPYDVSKDLNFEE